MPLPALATLDDYEAYTARTLDEGQTAGVARLLELVSAGMRREMRQIITPIEDDEITLWPADGELILPQRPVTAIASITAEGAGAVTTYRWNAEGKVVLTPTTGSLAGWPQYGWHHLSWGCQPVTVVYSHGYATVPDDLVLVACSMVARIRQNPTGLQQETIDGYSYIAGQATVAEKNLMGSYRRSAGTTTVRR